MTDRPRSVIVVLEPTTGEVEATMTRNGLQMFKHVARVIPVRGVPNEAQVADAIGRDNLLQALRTAEKQRDEAVARLDEVRKLSTGLSLVAGAEAELRASS